MPTASVGEIVANIAPKIKKDEESPVLIPSVDSASCIFSANRADVSVVKDFLIEFYPVSALGDSKCIEFNIHQTNVYYLDTRKSVIRVKAKIVTADGTPVKPDDHVGFVQSPLNSLWRNCDLLLQQQPMSSGIGYNIAYKNIIDQLVYTPENHLNTGGQTSGFYYDTPGNLNSVDFTTAGVNKGLLQRYEFTKDGHEVWCEGSLAHDFFKLPGYLPSGLQVILRLWPHSGDFLLMNGTETDSYKVKITECVLVMQGVELSASTLAAHNKILADTDAIWHYLRSNLRAYSVPTNISTWAMHQIFTDEIPVDLVVGLVESESYLGNDKLNPYLFGTHNLNFISFAAEGYQTRAFHLNYEDNQYAATYAALYEGDVGKITPGGVIKYKHFPQGYALYRFRLAPVSNERTNRQRRGVTRLTINFSKATTKALTVMVYGRFHDYFTMDLARNIQLARCDRV